MIPLDKPLVWLASELKTPPLSKAARRHAGFLLRRLQLGERLAMPEARPMPTVAARVYELRIRDGDMHADWRVMYRIDPDVIIVIDIFGKTTQQTPTHVITRCRRRLRDYDQESA